jgi:peptidyl-tRNA hydrolase
VVLYALVRKDLQMTTGKAAAQAGHAFLDSFLQAPPDITQAYLKHGGTKIVLAVADEHELCALYYRARMAKLPCAMVVESEHIMPPAFDGSPIVTAVGIGPLERSAAKPLLGGLRLM